MTVMLPYQLIKKTLMSHVKALDYFTFMNYYLPIL